MKPDAATDRRWMRAALAEARRAEGCTRPNPPVGAVLVRDGRLLSVGYHAAAGRPHAEAVCLDACAEPATGATLYITLEPCCTHGRTPPCTERIRASGVARVVVAIADPNPRHAGRGIALLRAAGVPVTTGVLARAAGDLLAPFACWVTSGRPFVTLKLAQSLDGAVADAARRSQWITGPAAREEVQRLRRRVDAILVGAGTVLADDPALLCRLPDAPPTLQRIVVDSRGSVPPTARVLADGQAARTVMVTTEACPQTTREAWQAAGASVWTLPPAADGRVNLAALLTRAGAEGWLHLLCEGGATLAGALVAAGLVDELWLFVAPRILGAGAVGAFGGVVFPLDAAPRFRIAACRRIGPDVLLRAVPRP